jgi:hypothetical protein
MCSGGFNVTMATKPPDGNERLDAHRRGEFVKEPVKKDLPPGRPQAHKFSRRD